MGAPGVTKAIDTRLVFIEGRSSLGPGEFRQAVREGLDHVPKWLPSRFFYDRAGSELFERITELTEYYPTRCESEILAERSAEIVSALGPRLSIVEFGSGSSLKTRKLLASALQGQADLSYVTIDISRDFLRDAARNLLADFPGLSVCAVAAEYSQAVELLPTSPDPRLILFLGSNIGNFCIREGTDFLSLIRSRMAPADRLLVGVDLEKSREVLHLAYNDPAGITAEFNRNLLRRINRELGGEFDPGRFEHIAPYDEGEHRIEMRLVSLGRQTVRVNALDASYEFEDGEFIVTEWSHKYTRGAFERIAREAGLRIDREWTDSKNWFAEFLLAPK